MHLARTDAAARLQLSEVQCDRLTSRQKSSESKVRELKAQITKLRSDLQREQESRIQMAQKMAASVQVPSLNLSRVAHLLPVNHVDDKQGSK